MSTNIVFFGSSQYSLIILQKLQSLSSFSISAVVTKTDKAFGRDQILTKNPVAEFAVNHHLPLLQPLDFDQDFIQKFSFLKPDLVLVVAYGPPFFNQTMIDIPKYKIVNIHPSDLPSYRGATPGPWQIINAETHSAVSFFQIDALPDHGPIIQKIPFEISDTDSSPSFYQKAFRLAADNLDTILKAYIQNPERLTPQDHSKKSYFPKFNQDRAQLDWSWPTAKIARFVRALLPWPTAWTYVKNQANLTLKMKIFSFDQVPLSVQIEGKTKADWSQISPYYQIVKNPPSLD
jgi:methionyl-tRNA formyltransferase